MWQCIGGAGAFNWFALVLLLSPNLKVFILEQHQIWKHVLPLLGFQYYPKIVQKCGCEGMLVPGVQKYRHAICGAVSQSQWKGMEGNVGAVIVYDESVARGNGTRIFLKAID